MVALGRTGLAKIDRGAVMGRKVVHFEIIGRDGEKLRNYYSELFDWSIDAGNPMNYGTIAPEDAGIGGGVAGYEGMDGHVTVYVQVPDVEESLQKAEQLGGERLMGPDEVEGAGITIGTFNDPEGHMVGLIQGS
jgi:predicted enzyme related to lactoylglutathione lyase